MSRRSETRQDAIMAKLYAESDVKVRDLSRLFQVSEETIRQDLSKLESLGLCARTHGGASLRQYSQVAVDVKAGEHQAEKNRLGRAAVERIKNGTAVWIGPGSTLSAMAKYLPLKKDLLIVTNSVNVAEIACSTRHEIVFLGGRIQKIGGCTVGTFALENLSHIRIDQAFIGCDGFVPGEGPTTFSFEEMEIHRRVMSLSKENILICDASKLHLAGTYIFSGFDAFRQLITTPLNEQERQIVSAIPQVFEVS